jgi:hypothetical protein
MGNFLNLRSNLSKIKFREQRQKGKEIRDKKKRKKKKKRKARQIFLAGLQAPSRMP